MSLIKQISRKFIFPTIVKLKAERTLSYFSPDKILILAYHGVSVNPDKSINGRHISAKQFENHLNYFQKNFNIITLGEAFNYNRNEIKPKKLSIVLTFDDGYENNFEIALPLLKKYNAPATFFILSKSLEDEHYANWPDIIDLITKYYQNDSIRLGEVLFKRSGISFFNDHLKITASNYIKQMDIERNNILEELKKNISFEDLLQKAPKDHWKLVSKLTLMKYMNEPLINIGSHSHDHFNLANISDKTVLSELIQSKQILENTIQKPVISIAYPDGSYSDTVKTLSLKSGYQDLLAVDYRCMSDEKDINILPRYCISNTTTFESNIFHIHRHFMTSGF